MRYRSTRQLVEDLRSTNRLVEVSTPVDPHLEIAEIQRRVFQNDGPAILFTNVTGCRFAVASNLFGSLDRARWIFRDTFKSVQLAIGWKSHPEEMLTRPWELWRGPGLALNMLSKRTQRASVMAESCQLSELPQIVSWPDDGGAFVTLPQVLSQAPGNQRLSAINLGMYRIQISGNDYEHDAECGLHYQLHRGIGVHHAEAIEMQRPFPVTITVGGTPAMTLAAVMPLPEGMSELGFAGALAGGRIPVFCGRNPSLTPHAPIYADADFAIVGQVDPTQLKAEGPFGDHLGYYSRQHPFPVLKVTKIWHRRDAVWPMTVVGRPPQEDTIFGQLIHELTEPVIPTVLPGVKAVHAVDAAGVHPLLLAIGSERYTPYARSGRPQELLTQASGILGQGQLSLAKYLWITDDSRVDVHNLRDFFMHMLARVDWLRDLHFHTKTTIDTLDYSGDGLNTGSKLVVAATGSPKRELKNTVDAGLALPIGWHKPRLVMPGALCIEAESLSQSHASNQKSWQRTCDGLTADHPLSAYPLVVLVDDSDFASRNLQNFAWVTFTRSNPAVDVYGIGATTVDKHFGVAGSLVIDARVKPHHAPPLIEDRTISAKVDALAASNLPISRYL